MNYENKTKKQLVNELVKMRQRISELEKSETKSRRVEKALRESEAEYRELVQNANSIILRINSEGYITFFNEFAHNFFGYTKDEISGRNLLGTVVPATDGYRYSLESIVKSIGDNPERYNRIENKNVLRNGKQVWIAWMNKAKLDKNGNFLEIICIGNDITEHKHAEEALRESEKKFKELSITDDLTGLYNSRHFYSQLKPEVERYIRYKRPLSLLLMDVDNFKQFNDNYGHLEGDKVLAKAGEIIRECIRKTDSAYRYGGEEFTVILPETGEKEAINVGERIVKGFNEKTFFPDNKEKISVTISVGIALYGNDEKISEFIRRADINLYLAKKQGKNRIFISR